MDGTERDRASRPGRLQRRKRAGDRPPMMAVKPHPIVRKRPEWSNTIHQGHVLSVLRRIPDPYAPMVLPPPPYWGLRDYKTEPVIWGGKPGCRHAWRSLRSTGGNGDGLSHRRDKGAGRTRREEGSS